MRRFVRRWPDLQGWFAEPLAIRVGNIPARKEYGLDAELSHMAKPFLLFLALHGFVQFDYRWLFACSPLFVPEAAREMGLDLGIDALQADARRLGFGTIGIDTTVRWSVSRIMLHTGCLHVSALDGEHIRGLREAVAAFLASDDLVEFYPSASKKFEMFRKSWTLRVNQLELLLFHRGQLHAEPRKFMRSIKERQPVMPRMQEVVDRWLVARSATDRPLSLKRFELALYRFMVWLNNERPEIESFARVTRDDVLQYVVALSEQPSPRTGQPLGTLARRGHVSALSQFFRNTATWEWDDTPARPLLGIGDIPKIPLRVPRFIPADELARLMGAVAGLECLYQRTALLIARWTGARKGEIQRLSVDCLDSYPDGTARLRLPAGKTYRERMVPLHEEAENALRELIAQRDVAGERALTDELTGTPTRYVFMSHGRLLSCSYLFQVSLKQACQAAGIVDGNGRRTISPHRFRHTVGTQLAERGAKLHTIMSILGHRSASMSLVYAQISDREVLRDYKSVLEPGSIIAGPAAAQLRSGALPKASVDWLKCNFFKTELELGHCLRLPAEGPCECDMYLTCAKFLTTPAYVPRLRERWKLEMAPAEDAQAHGWPNEQARHRSIADRITRLLTDLGEPDGDPLCH
ncbi:tyrosine-type recombinase/integrase [Paraburkholderia mimosarum]|uniref:tyrosine-type recombinase/integrase n=1 Tax=Paraburkholderia mimosarum TaxID=312026 RepID=UPI000688B395|nr:tyrosine-type recombinase/integrase [Paraburkholderia mimosarum]